MITSYLIPRLLGCSISATGLDTQYISWWIRHPQARSKQGKSTSLNSLTVSSPLVGFTVFGGMGREPKKTPPLRLPCLARSCGYPIHPYFLQQGKFFMSYSSLTTLNPFSIITSNL